MSAGKVRQFVADAAYDQEHKIAGVGVGYPDQVYAIIRSSVVPAASAAEAEIKAIIAGLRHLADCDLPAGSRVLNDCRHAVEIVAGDRVVHHPIDPTTIAVARDLVASHGYEVVAAKRGRTKSAHRGARISLAAWRQGRTTAQRIGGGA